MIELSIIIPAYNEAKRLPQTLEKVSLFLNKKRLDAEIIIVNDGSTDETEEYVLGLQKQLANLRLLNLPQNQGKGAAVKAGMLAAKGEYRLFMDADNSTDLEEINKLLPFIDDYPIIIGSRYLKKDSVKVKQSWRRQLVSRAGNFIIRRILRLNFSDTQCGFKLFRAEAAQKIFNALTSRRWVFDIEVLLLAKKNHFEVLELPVNWYNSQQSKMRQLPFWQTLNELILINRNARIKGYGQSSAMREFAKFVIVGTLTTLLDWSIYFLLTRVFGLFYLLAKATAFIAAALNSYYLNRLWTFESRQKKIALELGKFFLVSGFGLLLNTAILHWVVENLHLGDLIGLLIATIVVLSWNFLANKLWVFRREIAKIE